MDLTREQLAQLLDPRISLRAFGKVFDQKTQQERPFSPTAITKRLQSTILSYAAAPPLTEHGQYAWLVLLGYRQGGKSTVAELAFYPRTGFTPGWDHLCIADKVKRSDYLHQRIQYTHTRWDKRMRPKVTPTRERNQLTFDRDYGGKMRGTSADGDFEGIGQSPDSLHGSEVPFWKDAGQAMNLIIPSMINRDGGYMILESTPAPGDAPSVDWWKDTCYDAKGRLGRWIYAFLPFWDGILNARPWPDGAALDLEEQRMLDQFGPAGLALENLAFRRFMIETDRELRRNPDLFRVFYPFDDTSCWGTVASGVVGKRALRKYDDRFLTEWKGPYQEYERPEPGAIYIIGVDPAGRASRDHASFQVLKVYAGEWTQVATYSGHCAPEELAELLFSTGMRYNQAMIAIESNGVGQGTIAAMIMKRYPRLYYEKPDHPGVTTTSKSLEIMLSVLVESLMDELELNDADTLLQLRSYRNDKRVEDSPGAEMLRGSIGRNRRERHHWDKVSALQIACHVARQMPLVYKREEPDHTNVLDFQSMTYNAQREYLKKVDSDAKSDVRPKRFRYRSTRRKR